MRESPTTANTHTHTHTHTLFFFFRPAPKDEDEMMVAIFEYIDRIFNIVRPRRLLYMAIDGVVRTD